MKRFQWRLQRVLDVKRKQEQAMHVELMGIHGKIEQVRRERIRQISIIEHLIQTISRQCPNVRLDQQAFFMTCAGVNHEKIKRLEEELGTLEHLKKEKTAELLTLMRMKEGLEKLRLQEKIEFVREQEKREQKEMDEITTGRYGLDMKRLRDPETAISNV